MKSTNSSAVLALTVFSLLGIASPAYCQTVPLRDLDRDGIPNISDLDVDNDGILNGADRNIDGGIAKSGPLRGRFIGDKLPNNSPKELDMDSDGLADGSVNEKDIDGDRHLDSSLRETDIDGDGLGDSSLTESDIDGDGAIDGSRGEVDIDGDGIANGLDPDLDGDSLANQADTDIDGTGIDDSTLDILYESPGNPTSYADDSVAAPTIAFVAAEVRKILKVSENDTGLRVRVSVGDGSVDEPGRWGNRISGVWRYLSPDRIQVWARWSYPISDPSQLRIFVNYSYIGSYSGNVEDYTNPANYVVSDENRIYAGYTTAIGEFSLSRVASSPNVFISWLPGEPVGFFYTAPNEQATGFAPPYDVLRDSLSALPNFSSSREDLHFSGELPSSAVFPGAQPILELLRTIRQVNQSWYGQIEARQLR